MRTNLLSDRPVLVFVRNSLRNNLLQPGPAANAPAHALSAGYSTDSDRFVAWRWIPAPRNVFRLCIRFASGARTGKNYSGEASPSGMRNISPRESVAESGRIRATWEPAVKRSAGDTSELSRATYRARFSPTTRARDAPDTPAESLAAGQAGPSARTVARSSFSLVVGQFACNRWLESRL